MSAGSRFSFVEPSPPLKFAGCAPGQTLEVDCSCASVVAEWTGRLAAFRRQISNKLQCRAQSRGLSVELVVCINGGDGDYGDSMN